MAFVLSAASSTRKRGALPFGRCSTSCRAACAALRGRRCQHMAPVVYLRQCGLLCCSTQSPVVLQHAAACRGAAVEAPLRHVDALLWRPRCNHMARAHRRPAVLCWHGSGAVLAWLRCFFREASAVMLGAKLCGHS
jgi:hypothetical protein